MTKIQVKWWIAGLVFLIASSYTVGTLLQNNTKISAQDNPMKSDLTIYLDGALLNKGGTVFVVPREVPSEKWAPRPALPNPARTDRRLDERKPLYGNDRRLSVQISDQVSVVRFDYPANGTYEFRFLPTLESGVPPERQGSELLESGNTYDYHPSSGEELFVPAFQLFTILGPEADAGRSRELVSEVKLGFLEERYHCRQFDGALACSIGNETK